MHIIGLQSIHKFQINATCFDDEAPSTGSHKYEGAQAPASHMINMMSILYHSVQNVLSSSLLSKNLKIKIHRIIILSAVLYGSENWSRTLREERRLRVFENRVLRRMFGPKKDKVTGNGENYIMRSLMICTPYSILCGW